jgi:hypothetical protein
MITYGNAMEEGRHESFAETDEFSYQGQAYYIRITALHPYKAHGLTQGDDDLLVAIDFKNIATGETGRFNRVIIPGREPQDNNQRRHSVYRALPSLFSQLTPTPSPIFT